MLQDKHIGFWFVQLLKDIDDGSDAVKVQCQKKDKKEENLCSGVLQEELADKEYRKYREYHSYSRKKHIRA